jgi:hypothetical protein
MTKKLKDVELGERLRQLIQNRFGDRGRFRLLQEASGVPEWKWKNFFYRRQEAAQDQILFWTKTYPDDEAWLFTGLHPQDRADYPFAAEPPSAREESTIGDRLNWVIEELASPRGEALFSYLAGRYKEGISAEDWKKMVLRKAEPTLQMVALVCSDRPMFAEWVLLGHTSAINVNPTEKSSVERWKRHRLDEIERTLKWAERAKATTASSKEPTKP